MPRSMSLLCPGLAGKLWTNFLVSLGLNSFICKMETMLFLFHKITERLTLGDVG